MNTNKIDIIGKGLHRSSSILPKEGRRDLAKLNHLRDIGKDKSVYIRLDHYLTAINALEFAENQVKGLETIITKDMDASEYQSGLYPSKQESEH